MSLKGWAVHQLELFAIRRGAWYDLRGDGTLTPAMVWAPNPELAGDPRPITDPSRLAGPPLDLILAAAREHAVAQTLGGVAVLEDQLVIVLRGRPLP